MNREYTDYLLDHLPADQRKKILRNIKNCTIPGYRPGKLDSAPLGKVKGSLKSNRKFATQFLVAIEDMYNCSSEPYTDEERVPKLTSENFWGLFAWKCKT